MPVRLRLEELQDLVRHICVQRQRAEIGTGRRSDDGFLELLRVVPLMWFRLGKVQWRRIGGERKAITLLENGNIIDIFFSRVADFQEIRFQQRNPIRKKFHQRSMQIAAKRRVQSVLKDVREFAGNLGESWKPIAR